MNTAPRICFKKLGGFLGTLLLFVLLSVPSNALGQKNIPAVVEQGAVSILSHLTALSDPTGKLTIQDILDPIKQGEFAPLDFNSLKTSNSTFWLRFMLAPINNDISSGSYILDLGQDIPDMPSIFVVNTNMNDQKVEWKGYTLTNNSIFMLPAVRTGVVFIYIKLQGAPGLWFDPVIRTSYNAATTSNHTSKSALLVTLAVMMFFCILRGMTERREWWFWASLYLGTVLAKSYLGIPATPYGIVGTNEIIKTILPGISLVILIHIARHLMVSESLVSKSFGKQYLFLTIPGAAIALLPLIPNFAWTVRYIDLWPLAMLFLIPTTLGAWLSGIYGSRRFLIGCLIPPFFTAFAILGIGSGISSDFLATAPLWGVVFGILVIMAIGGRSSQGVEDSSLQEVKPKDATVVAMRDPSLRIVGINDAAADIVIPKVGHSQGENINYEDNLSLAWEEKLRVPLDTLSIEISALEGCSLSLVAKEHAKRMSDLVNNIDEALKQPIGESDEHKPLDISLEDETASFDLQQIMREAHDSVANLADQKNIGLSWFMPPVLGHKYVGNGQSLLHCLRLLLNNSVRATSHGAVKMSVRRVPESIDPGHLLFSITDTGLGMPPYRSTASLARVWGLVSSLRGFFGIECSPDGVSISFTLRLQPLIGEQSLEASGYGGAISIDKNIKYQSDVNTDGTLENYIGVKGSDNEVDLEDITIPQDSKQNSSIIIADYSLSNRQLLSFFLEGLPLHPKEARTPAECVELHVENQALLIIFDDDFPEASSFDAISKIRSFEMESGLPSSLILALTKDKSRWSELHDGGFTHALEKPITRSVFRNTIQELLYELVGIFPAAADKFANHEFNENDSVQSIGEEIDEFNYEDINAENEDIDDIENISNAIGTDDFLDSNIDETQSINSDYNVETDFEPKNSSYESDYDFADESSSIKIVHEKAKNYKNDNIPETFNNEQDSGFKIVENESLPQIKEEYDNLSSDVHVTGGHLNKAILLKGAIYVEDEPVGVNYANEGGHDANTTDNSIGANLNSTENKDDAYLPSDIEKLTAANDDLYLSTTHEIKDDLDDGLYIPSAAKEKIDLDDDLYLLSAAKEKNNLGDDPYVYSTEETKVKYSPVKSVISGAELLQQNSEFKDLMTEDEYKFFDENAEPSNTGVANVSESGISPTKTEQKSHSLIPNNSLLTDYIMDNTSSSSEGNDMSEDMQEKQANSQTSAVVDLKNNGIKSNVVDRSTHGSFSSSGIKINVGKAETVTDNATRRADISADNVPVLNVKNKGQIIDQNQIVRPTAGAGQDKSSNESANAAFLRLTANNNSKIDSPIPILLDELDESINYAKSGFKQNDALAIQDAAVYIAKRTGACGLRSLARMALCVEGAAKAKDFDALSSLLPELEVAIARNRASLQLHL